MWLQNLAFFVVFQVLSDAAVASADGATDAGCIQVVANSDLHGALEGRRVKSGGVSIRVGGLLAQSAYLKILREHYGERLFYVEAGDLFQGTLVSNHSKGKAVIDAYNALGLIATPVGNHEFDFGPLYPGDHDRLGVLKKRISEAKFSFLTLNIFTQRNGQRVNWPHTKASILIAGNKTKNIPSVGIMGISTMETSKVTRKKNVVGLHFPNPVALIKSKARRLRQQGAKVIVLLGHVGGQCDDLNDPYDLSSCDNTSELFTILRDLPPNTVHVVVGGHTHDFVGHYVGGALTIQAGANGRFLARAKVCIKADGQLDRRASKIHPPLRICDDAWSDQTCTPRTTPTKVERATFMGKTLAYDPRLVKALKPHQQAVQKLIDRRLAIKLPHALMRNSRATNLGTHIAEALRHQIATDFGVQNLGGVRSDLPAGALNFGQVFEVLPFGNMIAKITLNGAQMNAFVQQLLLRRGKPPHLAGLKAVSVGDKWQVKRDDGSHLKPNQFYTLATSDFLMGGGEGLDKVLDKVPRSSQTITDHTLRDALITWLEKRYPKS
jgi:5'-nucleotidase